MELRHLRYFVAVAEEQSVTRAAVRLGVSQPPLSRQIRDLESELGVSLFVRTANGVRLTKAGEAFLVDARKLLESAAEAVARTKAVVLGHREKLCVGHASGTVGIFRGALRAFSRTHSHVSVQLRELTDQEILRGLHDRSLDVALIAPLAARDLDGFAVESFGTYPVGLVMSNRHRFARRPEVPLREAAGEPFLGRCRIGYPEAHAALLRILAPFTRSPNVVEEYDSFGSLLAAVEAGLGVAFLVQINGLIAGRHLVIRPLDPALPAISLSVAYRPEGLSPAAYAFVAAANAARPKA